MDKLFIEDLPIAGKRILMRVDFNVPLDQERRIIDPTRIEAALPSIKHVQGKGGKLVLMSHLGRPDHEPKPEYSLAPCAEFLSSLLQCPVQMAPDCRGDEVQTRVANLEAGDVMLLENLRFHRAEEYPDEDPGFAKELASFGDFYINDAFGAAHRKHSSTYVVPKHFPGKAAAGYLMQKELHFLGMILSEPKRPFSALIGGAKISTKIGVLHSLIKHVDRLMIGGGMAYTFLKAQGIPIGDSLCEDKLMPEAKELMEISQEAGVEFRLPTDFVAAKECSNEAPAKLVSADRGIPEGYQGVDIGPKTVEAYSQLFHDSQTVLWNGPVGIYEFERFAAGTRALAQALSMAQATSIVGGGDLVAAIQGANIENITHISTGGGATLEYIESGTLPGIEALSNKK